MAEARSVPDVAAEQRVWITVAGARAEVRWKAEPVGRLLRKILRHLGIAAIPFQEYLAEGSSKRKALPAMHATLSFGASEAPVVVPEKAVQAAHFDGSITAWRVERRVFLTAGPAVVRLDPSAGAGIGHVGALLEEKSGRRLAGLQRRQMATLLALSLFALLRPRGFYPLHAAGLASPGPGAKGVLFVGASGAGKSTAAYSLVRRGWTYLSDDSVLLTLSPSGDEPAVEARPFRRTFGLAAAAAEAFPELASAWGPRLTDGRKRSLDVEALMPGQAAARCVPRLLVFPQVSDRPTSRLCSVSKSEAMHAVAGQSALVTLDPERSPQHLSALKRLIRQTRHIRLFAGRDLKENPLQVADLISPLLDDGNSA